MNENPKMKLNMINKGINDTCKENNKRANEIAQLKRSKSQDMRKSTTFINDYY